MDQDRPHHGSFRAMEAAGELDDPLAPYRAVARAPVDGRPWVMANMVAGLDGSASVGGRVGALSGPADQRLFHLLRSLADVVLVGAATVRRERYGAPRPDPGWRQARMDAGRPPMPRIAVVSRSLDLDTGIGLFRDAESGQVPLVVTCAAADVTRRHVLAEVADVMVAGDDDVDLACALDGLAGRGAGVVLTEGGPSLLGQLVEDDLLDELCLTLAPVMGGDALPVSLGPAGSDPTTGMPAPALVDFALGHVLTDDQTLFLRYERRR